MRHYGFLPFEVDPVGQVEPAGFWIVVTRDLFGQEFDYERAVLKLRRHQAEFLQSHFARMHFRGGGLFGEVAHNHALDLSSRLRPTLNRSKDRQFPDLTRFLQDRYRGGHYRRVAWDTGSRGLGHGRNPWRGAENRDAN